MSGPTSRVARNEAVFREVNERIREVSAHWASADAVAFVCECSLADCVEALTLTIEEYEAIRVDPSWFVVAPDHVVPDTERLVRTVEGRYAVVEKSAAEEFHLTNTS